MTSGMLKVWIEAQPAIFSLNSAAVSTADAPGDARAGRRLAGRSAATAT